MKRILIAFASGIIVGLVSMLAVVSANGPDCCTQVAVNTQRMERMDRDISDLKTWRIDHLEKTTSSEKERLRVLETTVGIHQSIFLWTAALIGALILGALIRLVLRKGQAKDT